MTVGDTQTRMVLEPGRSCGHGWEKALKQRMHGQRLRVHLAEFVCSVDERFEVVEGDASGHGCGLSWRWQWRWRRNTTEVGRCFQVRNQSSGSSKLAAVKLKLKSCMGPGVVGKVRLGAYRCTEVEGTTELLRRQVRHHYHDTATTPWNLPFLCAM